MDDLMLKLHLILILDQLPIIFFKNLGQELLLFTMFII